MTEIGRSRRVFDQIEFFLSEAKYEYAEALLFQLLNQDPSDRESRLHLLLVNVTREGPVLYEEDIDQLRNLSNLDDNEKEIVRKLFVLGFKSAEKEGRKDQIWAYQELLRRLLLNQQLKPPIPRSSARTPPAHQEPTPKLIDRTLDLARLNGKAVSLGWLVAVLEKTSSVCQIWFSRASQTIWPLKLSHTALAIAAVTPLMIPIAYFSLPQAATETSGHANATLSQPVLANSVLAIGPVGLSQQNDYIDNNERGWVHNIVPLPLFSLQRAYGNLIGSLLVKMELNPAVNVVKMEDVASRLAVLEFRKVALAKARKWSLHNASVDAARFTVPLLFVPSEMHSENIVHREKNLDSTKTEAKALLPVYITNLRLERAKSTIQTNPRTVGLKVAQAVETDGSKTQKLAGKPDQGIEYRTGRGAPLRQEPHFGASKTQYIDAGATIGVLETKGDWLKVKAGPSGAIGYVRKEYVTSLRISR